MSLGENDWVPRDPMVATGRAAAVTAAAQVAQRSIWWQGQERAVIPGAIIPLLRACILQVLMRMRMRESERRD